MSSDTNLLMAGRAVPATSPGGESAGSAPVGAYGGGGYGDGDVDSLGKAKLGPDAGLGEPVTPLGEPSGFVSSAVNLLKTIIGAGGRGGAGGMLRCV